MITTNFLECKNDLLDIVNLFAHFCISVKDIFHTNVVEDVFIIDCFTIDGKNITIKTKYDIFSSKDIIRFRRRNAQKQLYLILSKLTGYRNPWGALIGVRPCEVARKSRNNIIEYLQNEFFVSQGKAELVAKIVYYQDAQIKKQCVYDFFNYVNLYIHIPFCPTRCSYCSFITNNIKYNDKTSEYVENLVQEIKAAIQAINESNKKILSVYIGGGTPTFLDAIDLKKLVNVVYENIIKSRCNDNVLGNIEFTCEAGRPDTIDEEKLQILKDNAVNRICINPQSFFDKTLIRIGRKHTVDDIYNKFYLSKRYGFDINMDIIIGLPDETIDNIVYTIKELLFLSPENITIHTLSNKRGAFEQIAHHDNDVEKSVDFCINALQENSYNPYYLYKQKSSANNLENIGFCKDYTASINNITTMEDFVPIIACGAGAISKKFLSGSKHKRIQNPNDVALYISRIKDIIDDKKNFFIYK